MNPADKAAEIAASIADGSAIDWLEAASAAADPDERAILEELKAIATVATLHRTPSSWPVESTSAATSRWGPLTIVATVGNGRFGEVHLAWDARLQRRVALKRLHLASPSVAASPARAIEEARLLARVRHPNVLSVYGAECIDNHIGIWTEFIEGRTLEAMVAEDGPMPAADVLRIGIDLVRALDAVHAAGLLHRDVKAQNVMRETGGRIVLMDFGTGRDLTVVPQTSELSGTPLYLAPEVLAGGPATKASDLYALGVLLFRLLTAQYPVAGRTLDEVRVGHERHLALRLLDVRPDLPGAVSATVDRALVRDHAARYQTASDFEAALLGAMAALRTPDAAADDFAPKPGRRLRPWVWAGLTVGTAAALIPLALETSGGRSPGGTAEERPAADVVSLSVRRLANIPPHYLLGRPSRDGAYLPYVDPAGDLFVWKVSSGTSHRLTRHDGERGEWAVMSPDDRQVAYSSYTRAGKYELRVVDVDGASLRRLPADGLGDYPVPFEWSSDGQFLLCALAQADGTTHLALVPINGETPKILQRFRAGNPRNASLSPDGRFVVFDVPNHAREGRRDVLIAETNGSAGRVLVGDLANNLMPFWASNGTKVFFMSDRSGAMDGWVISVINGVAEGDEPQWVARNVGRVAPLALTAAGTFFYRLQTNTQDVQIVPVDAGGPNSTDSGRRASDAVVGGHIGPAWSPDGRFLAYVSATGNTALDRDSNTVTIQDAGSGRTRDLAPPISLGVAALQWAPDGGSLLVRGSDLQNRRGVFRVDVTNGQAVPVVIWNQSSTSEYSNFRWSPEGRGVFYLHDPRGIVWRDLSNGREIVRVPNRLSSAIRSFVVSPDGASLAFVHRNELDGTHTIDVRALGTAGRRIFSGSGRERLVLHAWTPDGMLLVTRYAAEAGAPHRLWSVAASDGEARDMERSIDGNTQVNRLALSPDGRHLAYTKGAVSWETWVMENFLPKL